MPSYTLAPWFEQQLFGDNGDPVAGGLLYTYLSGTSTPATTYADSTGTPNTNPVVLSAAGRMRLYLQPIAYKFILTDAMGVPVGLTMDPVTASASAAGSASGLGDVFEFGGNSGIAITQTAYPSGATFDKLHQGTAVFFQDSANLPGTYVIQATGVMAGAGTLSVAIMDLSSGAPDTPLAVATVTSQTGGIGDSGLIAFGAPGISRFYGIKVLVSANTGFGWGVHLVRRT